MTEKQYLIAISAFVPFGPARISLLLKYFGSVKKAWAVNSRKLLSLGLSEKSVDSFIKHRNSFDETKYFDKLKRLKIETITIFDKNYPSQLKEIQSAPTVIYLKGKIEKTDKNSVAIVGTRKMSSYGKEVAEKFSSELASLGLTIISGLARGIDTVAHNSAIKAGGRTIAVLGCGLDSVYPPENSRLANEIIKCGSAIISEYPLGYPALPINFAARNRIISGLSKAVLVVEGRNKSGTLLTANHAAEQGREVFAVPGAITSPLSEAPLYLLKNGAKIATEVADILTELDINLKVDKAELEKVMPDSPEEEDLVNLLDTEPLHIDEIARATSVEMGELSARLTVMEMKGLVKNMGGGIYKKI